MNFHNWIMVTYGFTLGVMTMGQIHEGLVFNPWRTIIFIFNAVMLSFWMTTKLK